MRRVFLGLTLVFLGLPAFAQDQPRRAIDPEQASMAVLAATRPNLDLTYHPGFNLITNEHDVPLSLQPAAPPRGPKFKGMTLFENRQFTTEINGKGLFYKQKDSVLGGAFMGRATEKSIKFSLQWDNDN